MLSDVILRDASDQCWYRFSDPLEVVWADHPEQVRPTLYELEQRVEAHGLWAAGFLSYEAAPGFDAALPVLDAAGSPLLVFALYAQRKRCAPPLAGRTPRARWEPLIGPQAHRQQLAGVHDAIGRGDLYQANLTYRLRGESLSPAADWYGLAADAPYGAVLTLDNRTIVSASPELFFARDGRQLRSMPMKGTAARGLTQGQDLMQCRWLAASEKNRAENLMITDMVRNDLGKVAQAGSVTVESPFCIRKFPTVWQMTSTVLAQSDAALTDVLSALFPAASITGAPKAASMSMIAAMECSPRGVYTGSIGFVGPQRRAQFNVAIRTLELTREDRLSYGVGGGLVWDSDADEEYQELQTKTLVLKAPKPPQMLLETLRWQSDRGYCLLERHMSRLQDSADYFGFECHAQRVIEALQGVSADFEAPMVRVRLMLEPCGHVQIEYQPLVLNERPQPVMLAPDPVNSQDWRLYHKQTNRGIYDRAAASVETEAEALLLNEHGHITESVIANLVYELEGQLYTPPVSDGLLPGVLRAELISQGTVTERSLQQEELPQVSRLHLVNALRGWREATLYVSPDQAASR